MNPTQIHYTYLSILDSLTYGSLKSAFDKTGELVQELQIGTYADQLHELQQNYKFLLNYYVNGCEDPDRKTVYNKLISRVFNLASALREELLMRSSSAFEYTQQRYFPHTRYYISVK